MIYSCKSIEHFTCSGSTFTIFKLVKKITVVWFLRPQSSFFEVLFSLRVPSGLNALEKLLSSNLVTSLNFMKSSCLNIKKLD